LQEINKKQLFVHFNDIEYIVKVLFSDNSYLLFSVNVGNLTDSGMCNLSYIKNRIYTDLQYRHLCYHYYHMERSHGSFRRDLTLVIEVDPAKIEAICKDGVLTITVPKSEKSKPVKVKSQ
jgi:hypothetical protein